MTEVLQPKRRLPSLPCHPSARNRQNTILSRHYLPKLTFHPTHPSATQRNPLQPDLLTSSP